MLFLRVVAATVVGFVKSLRARLEILLIIYPIEILLRLWYHLDPRVYSERLRIRRVTEGRPVIHGDRFVLFVFYSRSSLPVFTQTVIDAIRRRGLNLVISTNAKITFALRETLLDQCHLLVERVDLGRDFGGYKDGMSIIEKRFGIPDRLILLNDSLFYFDKGLDGLIAALDGEGPLIGMCEDHHLYYHIQSFALSFGRPVLSNRRVRLYWRKYRPVSTRRWAIGKGERALTRQVLRAGFRPRIIYSAGQLMPFLKGRSYGELLEAIRYLPEPSREALFRQLQLLREVKTVAPLPMLDSMSRSVRRLRRLQAVGERELHNANLKEMLTLTRDSLTLHQHHEEHGIDSIGENIAAMVGDRNQIHFGGFLFVKYLGMPAIKRDLFFRELYSLDEVAEHLLFLSGRLHEEILADMRQKGTARLLGWLPKILYRHGSI